MDNLDSLRDRLDTLQGSALELAGRVGDGVRHVMPDTAGKWLQTGVALGAARTGAKAAGRMVRRNPALTVAAAIAVAGAGLLVYAVRRRKRETNGRGEGATIEGKSRRVEANRGAARPRKTKAAPRRAQRTAQGIDNTAEAGANRTETNA